MQGLGGSWPLFQGQLGRKQMKSFYVTQILDISFHKYAYCIYFLTIIP